MHPVLANANPFKTSAAYLPAVETAVTEPSGHPVAEVTAGPIPAGYVLVERELLGRVVKRLKIAVARDREQLRERMVTLLERVMQ